MLKIKDKKIDTSSNCISLLTEMELNDYIHITSKAFEKDGNLEGQRGVINRSSSASKIRDRMFKDFKMGAVFPPVVIGVLISEDEFSNIKSSDIKDIQIEFSKLLTGYEFDNISIIDGVQRSNVYKSNLHGNENREIRVEYWITTNITSLLYRMLVLNTGQVPWNVRRQVEVVYKPLLTSIETRLINKYPEFNGKIKFFDVNSNGKRTNSGEYHKNQIVELFLSYNLRTEKVDVQTQLAEDFQKIDMMEALQNEESIDTFVDIFARLCELDLALGEVSEELAFVPGKFMDGKSLFSSHPVRIGYIVAATNLIIGKIGRDKSQKQSEKAMGLFSTNTHSLISKIQSLKQSPEEIKQYLAFDILNELLLALPKSKVGDAERSGFKNVFTELLQEEDDIQSLLPYWRSL
jgi:hypothetical protein